MTLRELQKHINATVAANDANPALAPRNEMRVCVEMRRNTKRFKTRGFEVDIFYRGQVDYFGTQFGAAIPAWHRRLCDALRSRVLERPTGKGVDP